MSSSNSARRGIGRSIGAYYDNLYRIVKDNPQLKDLGYTTPDGKTYYHGDVLSTTIIDKNFKEVKIINWNDNRGYSVVTNKQFRGTQEEYKEFINRKYGVKL